ncbi:unnamed protein product, partial [Meganyctiphanes norvegica]
MFQTLIRQPTVYNSQNCLILCFAMKIARMKIAGKREKYPLIISHLCNLFGHATFTSASLEVTNLQAVFLSFFGYMTVTWVVESMACANAICHHRRMKQLKKRGQVADELVNRTLENAEAETRSTDTSEDHDGDEEEQPLITDSSFVRERDSKFEMKSLRSPSYSPRLKSNMKSYRNKKEKVVK